MHSFQATDLHKLWTHGFDAKCARMKATQSAPEMTLMIIPALFFAEMRENGPRDVHYAEDIDLKLLLYLFPRDRFEQAVLAVAGIVEQRVDLPETRDAGFDRLTGFS